MIRLTLRQFRSEAAIGFGALIVVGIVLAVTGPHLVSVYDSYMSACKRYNDCASSSNPVTGVYTSIQTAINVLVLTVPALVGIFWGAPLIARELETGTFRLAWTQSVTRTRWLAVKLGVVGLASMVIGGFLSLMSTWWMNPISLVNQNRFSPGSFGLSGIVPFGYAAFAFALGVTAGVVIRRTLPAMTVSLFGFIGVRLAFTYWIRPHLASPIRLIHSLTQGNGIGFALTPKGLELIPGGENLPNAWVLSTEAVNKNGVAPTSQVLEKACPSLIPGSPSGPPQVGLGVNGGRSLAHGVAPGNGVFQNCIAKLSASYHVVMTYQPANRYWPFQIYETAIFLVISLLLGAVCWWWLRNRLT